MRQSANHGRYFLGERDWESLNKSVNSVFPWRRCVREDPEEGDQGFEDYHEPYEYYDDCCGGVIKVCLRYLMPVVLTSDQCPHTAAAQKHCLGQRR